MSFTHTVRWSAPKNQSITKFKAYLYYFIIGDMWVGDEPTCPKIETLASKSSPDGWGPWFVATVSGTSRSASWTIPSVPALICGVWVVAYNAAGASEPGEGTPPF